MNECRLLSFKQHKKGCTKKMTKVGTNFLGLLLLWLSQYEISWSLGIGERVIRISFKMLVSF